MDVKIEKIKYQENKKSYFFAMLAIVMNITFLFVVLNAVTANFIVGIKILFNIGFMLSVFLGMEKAKYYSRKWSIILMILGFITIGRIFFVPFMNYLNDSIEVSKFIQLAVLLGFEGLFLFISGLIGYRKSHLIIQYKDEFAKLDSGDYNE